MEQLTPEEFLLLLKQLRVDALHNAMIETDARRLRLHLLKTVRDIYPPCAADEVDDAADEVDGALAAPSPTPESAGGGAVEAPAVKPVRRRIKKNKALVTEEEVDDDGAAITEAPPKSDAERADIIDAVRRAVLFKGLGPAQLDLLARCALKLDTAPGRGP